MMNNLPPQVAALVNHGQAVPQNNGYTQATGYLNQYIQSLRARQAQQPPIPYAANPNQPATPQQMVAAGQDAQGVLPGQQMSGGVPQAPQPGMQVPGVPNQPQSMPQQGVPQQPQPMMAYPTQVPPQVQALAGTGLSQGGRMPTQVR